MSRLPNKDRRLTPKNKKVDICFRYSDFGGSLSTLSLFDPLLLRTRSPDGAILAGEAIENCKCRPNYTPPERLLA
jgi:hypothetical protein